MKTIFCKFLDKRDKNNIIKIKPLGKAKNIVGKPTLPGWKNIITEIIIDKKYARGLDGLKDYSHIIVVYWIDKEVECHLKHHPQGKKDIPYVGIFACRCPQRPNRIAVSTVKLLSRKGNKIRVKGLDIVNNTPIIDIKPYTPQFDRVEKAKAPAWLKRLIF